MNMHILTTICCVTIGASMLGCGSSETTNETPAHRSPTQPAEETPSEVRGGVPPAPDEPPPAPSAEQAPSTVGWAVILENYVTADGGFQYAALIEADEHRALLSAYVQAVGGASTEGLSRDDALAFYINAYNALTIHSVLELWPVRSVMQEEGFFDARTHQVAGIEQTLNALENETIRGERFSEPRIHFAVNCASTGCPPLANTPYSAETLETQLTTAAESFVRATTAPRGRGVRLSQIFEWFADDFGGADGVREFVSAQLAEDSEITINHNTRLSYTPYDWALNGR